MLEASLYQENFWCTLTYSPDKLPGNGSLEPVDLKNWLKRYRDAWVQISRKQRLNSPIRLRFYGVGEYGETSWRPHYHVALFGLPGCRYGQSRFTHIEGRTCCEACDMVHRTWGKGAVELGALYPEAAGYIAGYIDKKLTRFDDPRLSPGMHPEFARMSTGGEGRGLGYRAMRPVAQSLVDHEVVPAQGDVPVTLRHGDREWPLDRYLRKALRRHLGRDEKAPESALQEYSERLLPVRLAARADPSNPSFKAHLVAEGSQAALNMMTRHRIWANRRKI